MTLEIVTHCFRYSRLLRYQLSSLVLWPPVDLAITVTVFYTKQDAETSRVLEWFGRQTVPGVSWNWQAMHPRNLCRRSIGRNRAALRTKADWVWFTDADHWFGPDCWAAFATLPQPTKPLIYPRDVLVQATHALGDACVAAADGAPGLIQARTEEFLPMPLRRAIGGVQIVRGAVCRADGYLRHARRWQRPPRVAIFQRCREDVVFRRALGTSGEPVTLPNVYRLRHSRAGRTDISARL